MVEVEFFRPHLNKTMTQTITVLIRMVTPPTSGTMIIRIVLVESDVLSIKSVAIGGNVLEFEGIESVVGGVDVVVGGILVPRVPGTVSLNLAAIGTKPIMTNIN